MSQSEFWAKLCAGKIGIDSSIQAQVTGEVMRRKWRIIGISDNRPNADIAGQIEGMLMEWVPQRFLQTVSMRAKQENNPSGSHT